MKYCSSCQSSYPLDYTACPKDQTPLQLATDLMPGMVLRGKYEIIEKLGAGGMGAVYKARHLAFGEFRAIKFVSAHLLADERALARFRSEAVVARRLQHPNAMKVEDLDATDDGRPFIVMEYVKGSNLRDFFHFEGDVSTKRIITLARQTCGALAAAHALGIVHRDIKPDNLMVVSDAAGHESVKVADFGLAKVREGFELAVDKPFTQTGFMVGTPPYMSPEQAQGLEVDGRSDLYSLGVVLYEMFTGRLPFRSDTPLGMLMHHRDTPPEPPTDLGVAQPVASFLLKALAKQPADRFQTAEQMDEALRLLSLMPLPQFVGQGIREGFDPKWAGSRHASQVTTMRPTPALKSTAVDRPGAKPPTARATKSPSTETGRTRFIVQEAQAPPDSPMAPRILTGLALGVVVLAGYWALRPALPEASPTPSLVPAAPSAEINQPMPAPSAPAAASNRTDVAIRFDIDRMLKNSNALREAHIQVEVINGLVTLAGDAPNEAVAQVAVGLASTVPGVRQVLSALHPPTPAVVQAETASGASLPAATQPEPSRAPGPPPQDPSRDQVRVLMERARQKMEGRDPEGAEVDLTEALKLDPNNATAKDALEKLRNRPRPPGPRPTR